MAWDAKKYTRINWKNRPSTATALGATNLNKMDVFLNDVDNELITMDAGKLDIATANGMLKTLEIDVNTGKIKATELGGTTHEWDLNIEKIPASFSLQADGTLVMTTDDGEQYETNIANAIRDYEFEDSDTIGFTKEYNEAGQEGDYTKKGTYTVTAIVKAGSITGDHLNPDYRAEIQTFKNDAESAKDSALQYSKDAKRYSEGDAEYEGSETDNAKYYYQQAKAAQEAAEAAQADAEASKTAAEQSEQSASDSAAEALASKQAAEESKDAAAVSQAAAMESEGRAKTSQEAAQTSQEEAVRAEATATQKANDASGSAAAAEKSAKTAQSYATGDSNSREGEEADNAKEYARQAAESAKKASEVTDVAIMTPEKAGIGKPDDVTVKVDGEGTLSIPAATEETAGIVKPDGTSISVSEGGVLSVIERPTKSWDVTLKTDAWKTDSESTQFAGMTASFKQTVTCDEMTADTDIGGIVFISGDRASAAAWAWLAPNTDSVTLYAVTKPTKEFSLRLWEVK